ncbi:hypothetical protein O3M35_009893 [Rhynocoris fuscipes]|uniref:EF-hand domain-containing protein n=1 Tax=Rhynocoris fuscipes TaxID=488301 RepID=A0AAW1D9Z0_9HEMI
MEDGHQGNVNNAGSRGRSVNRSMRRSGAAALLKSLTLFYARTSRGRERLTTSAKLTKDMKSDAKQIKGNEYFLKKATHFTRQETENLLLIYDKLASASNPDSESALVAGHALSSKGKEGLERVIFRDLLHNTFGVNTEEILMDRIFCAFDTSCDGIVRQDEWLIGMSAFLKGSLQEKIAFAFSVYDLNNDGYIVREEMFNLLRNSLVKQPQDEDPDEGVKELVELVLKKLDRDKDGKVSFEDFSEAVHEEPLFLEAFGQCLPSDNAVIAFLSTLS